MAAEGAGGPEGGASPPGPGKGRRLKGLVSTMKKGYSGMRDDMSPEDDDRSEISIKRRRFAIIVLLGAFLCIAMFLVSISIASGGIIPISDAISSLISAIQKGGQDLDLTEMYIFQSRLPRTIAAIGVGALIVRSIFKKR